jgi:hypothetical protein
VLDIKPREQLGQSYIIGLFDFTESGSFSWVVWEGVMLSQNPRRARLTLTPDSLKPISVSEKGKNAHQLPFSEVFPFNHNAAWPNSQYEVIAAGVMELVTASGRTKGCIDSATCEFRYIRDGTFHSKSKQNSSRTIVHLINPTSSSHAHLQNPSQKHQDVRPLPPPPHQPQPP